MPSEPVGQEAFAVLREAMRGKGMVALGRLVLSKRGKWSDQLRRPDRSSLRANSDNSFNADVSERCGAPSLLGFALSRCFLRTFNSLTRRNFTFSPRCWSGLPGANRGSHTGEANGQSSQ